MRHFSVNEKRTLVNERPEQGRVEIDLRLFVAVHAEGPKSTVVHAYVHRPTPTRLESPRNRLIRRASRSIIDYLARDDTRTGPLQHFAVGTLGPGRQHMARHRATGYVAWRKRLARFGNRETALSE
jgi:hypothetical protein